MAHAGGMRLSMGYGRLYVTGPNMHVAQSLPGAALNQKRHAYELTLTLETMRALRKAAGVSKQEFASYCPPELLAWARAAHASEETVNAMHERLASGWRPDLPWLDTRAMGPAGPEAREGEVYEVAHHDGRPPTRLYKYREPYDHQRIMAAMCLSLDGCAIMGQVGTGKTRAAIEAMSHLLRTGQLGVVVVCGKKATLANVWKDECSTWATNLTPIVLSGAVTKRRAMLRRIINGEQVVAPGQCPVVLLNHDVIRLLEPELIELAQAMPTGFVIDESQKIRNPDAKVTQAAMRVANVVRWRLIMTGSPVIQGEQDVWAQWYTIDLGVTFGANFVQYRREWLVENPYTYKTSIRDAEAQTEIGLRMRRRGFRITKAEGIPDLPPQVWMRHDIELTPAQTKAYAELEEELITQLSQQDETFATAANQLTMILRLTQITSGFVKDEQGAIHAFSPNPKLAALQELVEENIGDGAILIWAWYREDIERIARTLSTYDPVIVYGGQSDAVREANIRKFTSGQSRILVGNQASGGVGLNLQIAPLAIYYSQGYNLEDREQSEGRNHRGGSQMHEQVTYYDLVATGTIDEVIRDALRRKKRVADAVVDLKRAIGMEE